MLFPLQSPSLSIILTHFSKQFCINASINRTVQQGHQEKKPSSTTSSSTCSEIKLQYEHCNFSHSGQDNCLISTRTACHYQYGKAYWCKQYQHFISMYFVLEAGSYLRNEV